MAARILEGREFAQAFKEDAKQRAEAFRKRSGMAPGLAAMIVGENPASKVYVRNKGKACEELGIRSETIALPETATREDILSNIDRLNKDERMHGILVQLPLPDALSRHEPEILSRIDPRKDVDGFHPVNAGRLASGLPGLVPCTPAGCIRMLEMAGIPMEGKRAVVIGRSNIVGKPMAQLLLSRNATVTICHSRTKDLPSIAREADILVAAIGKPKFVTADMVKPGAAVIDVGINRIAPKKLVGDVDFDAVKEVAGFVTPVPGGVGLLTVAMLMQNVVQAAEMQMELSC